MTPELSFILVSDRIERVRGVLAAVAAQTIADRIELVLALSDEGPEAADAVTGVGSVTIICIETTEELPLARALAVRAAHAPVVVFGETHCIPEPGYAEAYVTAHRGPWAAVGPAMLNGNPQTAMSWAAFLMDYCPWFEGNARGPFPDLPSHNGSFKRDALLAYGDALPARLADDAGLARDLVARGGLLAIEPGARTRHLNTSTRAKWFDERFSSGRSFAGTRREGWPAWRALGYAAASPLIPLVRAARIVPRMSQAGAPRRVLPALALALYLSAAGECVGYLWGPGDTTTKRWNMELRKGNQVRPGEASAALQAALAGDGARDA